MLHARYHPDEILAAARLRVVPVTETEPPAPRTITPLLRPDARPGLRSRIDARLRARRPLTRAGWDGARCALSPRRVRAGLAAVLGPDTIDAHHRQQRTAPHPADLASASPDEVRTGPL